MFQQQRTTDNAIENNGKRRKLYIFYLKFLFSKKGLHYQYPNNDPEFFNGHSPNEQIFNGENQTSTGKGFFFCKVKKIEEFDKRNNSKYLIFDKGQRKFIFTGKRKKKRNSF
jgi:hypothetical protein